MTAICKQPTILTLSPFHLVITSSINIGDSTSIFITSDYRHAESCQVTVLNCKLVFSDSPPGNVRRLFLGAGWWGPICKTRTAEQSCTDIFFPANGYVSLYMLLYSKTSPMFSCCYSTASADKSEPLWPVLSHREQMLESIFEMELDRVKKQTMLVTVQYTWNWLCFLVLL